MDNSTIKVIAHVININHVRIINNVKGLSSILMMCEVFLKSCQDMGVKLPK